MEKIKVKILKDFEAAPDGIRLVSYKAKEVLELGTPRMTMHLWKWIERNPGYAEFIKEENKLVISTPENKAVPVENLEKDSESSEAVEEKAEEPKFKLKKRK